MRLHDETDSGAMGQPLGPFDNVFSAPSENQQNVIQSPQIDKDRASSVVAVDMISQLNHASYTPMIMK